MNGMLSVSRVAGLLCVPFLLACSSASTSPPQPKSQEPQVATPTASAIIEVKPLTVRFEGNPIARLHADGRTESVGDTAPGKDAKFSPGPTLHSDGTIELTKGGVKARVERDGDIFIVSPPGAGHPEQLYGRISGDQLLTEGSRDSGVRLEGSELVLFHESKVTNVLGVIDPPNLRRTALVMAAAFYIDLAITSR